MRSLRPLVAVITLTLAGVAGESSAQQQQQPAPKPGPTEESYRKARAVLAEALRAHFGEAGIASVKTLAVKIRGGQFHRQQSPKADDNPISTPFQAELISDFERSWTVWERTGSFPGGIEFSNRWLIKGNEGTNADLLRKTTAPLPNAAAFAENQNRRHPYYWLRLADSRAASLRWLGETDVEGAKYNNVAVTTATGGQFNLFFDAGSKLLMRIESLQSDPMRGDVVAETIIKGYAPVNGMPLPIGQVTKLGRVRTQDVDYSDWRVNAALDAALFEAPAGLRPAVQSASASPSAGARAAEPPSVRDLSGGLYSVEGIAGYRVLFMEFSDHVMVFEAPVNDATAQIVKRLVKEKVPAKPIRYVAVTHHHDDHAGSLRSFLADCVVVITTPGNQNALRAALAAPFTIAPDELARKQQAGQWRCPPPLSDYLAERSATFTDGTRRVELHNIGPSPHADEMLVAWFPAQKILYQGDLWNREADGTTRPANDTTLHFAEWVAKSGLPVERIIGVHGPEGTPAQLQEAVRLRRAAGN